MSTPSRSRIRLAAAAALAIILFVPSPVRAAGFSVYEQGGRAMGFAGAYTALSLDPSAIFYNPAGVAFLKQKQIYFGATLVKPWSDFTGVNPFPGTSVSESSSVSVIPVPTLYYTQPFSQRVVFGLGLNAPFGLRTQWANPATYSGRYISESADVKTIAIVPTVAFKLADRFSLAASLNVMFSKVQLVRRVPSVNPFTQTVVDIAQVTLDSNWDVGFGLNLGLLAKPTDNFSVGVAYRSKVRVDYGGSATFDQISTGNAQLNALVALQLPSGAQPLTTSIDFPASVPMGVAYQWENWTLAVDAVWFQWSTFSTIDLTFTSLPSRNETIVEDYSNSWQFRVGIERKLNRAWTVRGGYFYDQSPAPAASVSPILPDADRNGVAAGATWKSGRLWIDMGTWYLFFKTRSTEGVNRDNYNGNYSSSALMFAVSFGYSF